MSDPLQRATEAPPRANLWTNTSAKAGSVAAQYSGQRRMQILRVLGQHGPLALFEIAALLECFDHQISGRFSELEKDGLIYKTGQRKVKSDTGCEAEIWALRDPIVREDIGELLGYPATLSFDGDLYERQPLCITESFPGIPYRRRTDQGLPIVYRFEFIECPQCGTPLRLEKGKQYKCINCGRQAEGALPNEPGKSPTLALLFRTL